MTAPQHQPPVMYGQEQFPLFKRVSLETTSNCNRACTFCPVSTGRRDFPQEVMSMETFGKIIGELESLKWNGVLQMFLLNEPLLDPLMLERLKVARAALKRSTIYLSTNGDPVAPKSWPVERSVEKLLAVYDAGATTINLNVYDEGPDQFERYSAIVQGLLATRRVFSTTHKYNAKPRDTKWVALTDMRKERLTSKTVDMFYDRTKEDRSREKRKSGHCARTQRHLVILFDGRVPICCAIDPTDDSVPFVGDVTKSSLIDVWNAELFFKYRYYTQRGSRDLPSCDTCNHRMAYPHMVRHVDAPDAVKARWRSAQAAYESTLPVVAAS